MAHWMSPAGAEILGVGVGTALGIGLLGFTYALQLCMLVLGTWTGVPGRIHRA